LIAVELAQKPALLEYCSQHLKHIFYAGGHLPKAVGDVIAAKIPIHCQYGATEIGLSYQLLSPDMTGADWQYTRYHPELGFEFEEVTPGLFELVVKRDPRYERNQVTFTMGLTLEDHSAYRTRDLFEKHATLTDSWGWRARADDIIVFLNGEKTNPISMEQYIVANNEDVANAMVVGMQRFQAALIVEPVATLGKLSPGEATVFIEKIWPTVEEANKSTPAHARIEKSMVMVTDPDKPIMRSGKGTIQRQGSVSQYAAEIDQLYSRLETGLFGCKPASVNTKDTLEVSRFIRRAISQINPDLLQEGTDSFFSLGMDSLMAMRLVRALRHGLGRSDVDVSVVYNNPSVRQLTEYVVGGQTAGERDAPPQHTELEALLKEYEQVIGGALNKPTSPPPGPLEFVVLTGSTGSLGTHLLEAFLANPTIAHIYCLNRRGDAEDLHEAKAKAAGFQLDQHRHRVSFIHADLAQPNLGLDGTTYNVLRSTATLIVHNAWPVNFIMPLNTFRPQFDGLINLFRLASRAEPPKVLYISSISSVAQLSTNSDSRVIPEEVIEDFEAPQDIGYAKSKLLSELLCDFAARCLHIPVSVARVGQVAGPVGAKSTGLWNTTEWLPSLIITSMSFGALPDDLGAELNKVDWIPADLLAEALVELGTNKGQESHVGTKAEVFNVVSPRTTTWEKLLPSIVSSLKKHTNENVSVVPLQSWLQQLQKCVDDFSAGNVDLAHTHPAIKLQNFYERAMLNRKGPVEWETAHATAKSKTLKEMPAVRNQWVEKWVQVWIAELMSRRKDHVLTTLVSMGGFRR
jgi:thioester reductase-like protein